MSDERVFEILVIEDNRADAHLIKEAWNLCTVVRSNVSILEDSRAAIVYLRGELEFKDKPHPRPNLILLDYVMPVNGGLALTEIKGDPEFMTIPVVCFTASQNPDDHQHIYMRHANCCFMKPSNLDEFLSIICYLAEFWLVRAIQPPVPKLSVR